MGPFTECGAEVEETELRCALLPGHEGPRQHNLAVAAVGEDGVVELTHYWIEWEAKVRVVGGGKQHD